jgi:hypothetical protein
MVCTIAIFSGDLGNFLTILTVNASKMAPVSIMTEMKVLLRDPMQSAAGQKKIFEFRTVPETSSTSLFV